MKSTIYTVDMIPSFSNEALAGAKQWWNEKAQERKQEVTSK